MRINDTNSIARPKHRKSKLAILAWLLIVSAGGLAMRHAIRLDDVRQRQDAKAAVLRRASQEATANAVIASVCSGHQASFKMQQSGEWYVSGAGTTVRIHQSYHPTQHWTRLLNRLIQEAVTDMEYDMDPLKAWPSSRIFTGRLNPCDWKR